MDTTTIDVNEFLKFVDEGGYELNLVRKGGEGFRGFLTGNDGLSRLYFETKDGARAPEYRGFVEGDTLIEVYRKLAELTSGKVAFAKCAAVIADGPNGTRFPDFVKR